MKSSAMLKEKLSALGCCPAGAATVLTAIMVMVFIGILALSVDIGRLVLVKSELQRAADAGALAGAMGLVPYTGSGNERTPDWLQGQSKALEIINSEANKVENEIWNFGTEGVSPNLYWETTINEKNQNGITTTATISVPAVRVSLTKDVGLFFASLMGISGPITVNAIATAILPEGYSITNLVPISVRKDLVYTITDGGSLEINADEQTIKPTGHAKDASAWFNTVESNSAADARIQEPLTSSKSEVYIVPGAKATLVQNYGIKNGQTIIMTIVADPTKKGFQLIEGFAAFYVKDVTGPKLDGHFLNRYFDPDVVLSSGSGINLGVMGTPKLVGP